MLSRSHPLKIGATNCAAQMPQGLQHSERITDVIFAQIFLWIQGVPILYLYIFSFNPGVIYTSDFTVLKLSMQKPTHLLPRRDDNGQEIPCYDCINPIAVISHDEAIGAQYFLDKVIGSI